MKTHNGVIVWAMASVVGGCAPMDPAPVASDVHMVPVGGASASSSRLVANGALLPNGAILANGAIFPNGAMLANGGVLQNGAILNNGAALPYGVVIASDGTRVLALTNLASRPLGRSGGPVCSSCVDP
ncbi:MAG: hypothetical protein V5B35_16395 [Candidatus Accumulibacter necessarius]|jgi:hypothetical protein|uniref:hypothetical protein n=1 Tax=Candidatus Accumulibacter necessarius TaxID=2954386 RepID=UPI002FC2D08C